MQQSFNLLIAMGLVKIDALWTESRSRGKVYYLAIRCSAFWYRFVFPPSLNTIMMGKGEDIFREVIEPELRSSYMGPVFRGKWPHSTCAIWRMRLLLFRKSGAGETNPLKNGRKRSVCWLSEMKRQYLAGASGQTLWWRKEILLELVEKSKLFSFQHNYYFLFAKRGFTRSCIEEAEGMSNVRADRNSRRCSCISSNFILT